jgi:hypothetical protein
VRWSARHEETLTFYRNTIGLPVLGTFHDSYGLDGTILGLPAGQVHLEIVRAGQASYPGGGLDQLVFYLPDAAAWEQMQARLGAGAGDRGLASPIHAAPAAATGPYAAASALTVPGGLR